MTSLRGSVGRNPALGHVPRGRNRALAVLLGLILAGSGQLARPAQTTAGPGDAPNLVFAGEFAAPGVPMDHLILMFDEIIDPDSIPAGADFTITIGTPVDPGPSSPPASAAPSGPPGTPAPSAAPSDPGTSSGPMIVQGAAVSLVYAGFGLSALLGEGDVTFLKLTLPAGVTVTSADNLLLGYTPGANPIRDLDLPANETAAISGFTNIDFVNPSDLEEPMMLGAAAVDSTHGADTLILLYSRPIDPNSLPLESDFDVEIRGPAPNQTEVVTPTAVSLFRPDLNIGMLDLKLPFDVTTGQQVFLTYTPNPIPGTKRIRNAETGAEASAILQAEIPVVLDSDGDGLANDVDTRPATFSAGFDDRATTLRTFGTIVDRGGLDVTVKSAATGVRIAASGAGGGTAVLRGCVDDFAELHLTAGDEVVVNCGSITTQVISGPIEIVLGDGTIVVSVPDGVTAVISDTAIGSFSVENLVGGTGNVTITVDGVEETLGPGHTSAVVTAQFVGFSAPVDNPDVVNVAKAGGTVPLKWRLLSADGTPITNLASAVVGVSPRDCQLGTAADLLGAVTTGASRLQNLGNGYYQLNWKSPRTYANSCKTLKLDLGEGITHDAFFNFTR